ncbi:MAG: aromatic amino acid ammonia-lyase [Planctomycetota bacterium]|nr:aromatic amino acid ammonia-lyase [Planctomycetota bacterium]
MPNQDHPGADDTCLLTDSQQLTIDDVVNVGRHRVQIELPHNDVQLRNKLRSAVECVEKAVRERLTVYGVNTGFGGMSGVQIGEDATRELQENLIWFLKAGAGKPLQTEDVRGAMLLRVRSFLWGASGVRWEIIERIEEFLNRGLTPLVREFGSIGASGDLIPMASIAGALIGLGNEFKVYRNGEHDPAGSVDVLEEVGLSPIRLEPKEGLAMVNGTSMSTAMAASCLYDARFLFAVTMGAHALMIQALSGMVESFDDHIHKLKPHPGQRWVARRMRELLRGSQLVAGTRSATRKQASDREEALITIARSPEAMEWVGKLLTELRKTKNQSISTEAQDLMLKMADFVVNERTTEVIVDPIQDRYSVRCLPQFIGPIRDGLLTIIRQVECEMNSANDNPLIDGESGQFFHGGNFLGQYTAVAMDQLRYYVGMLAKHLDAQISLLVAPEFSQGLPPSLVGNMGRSVNMGLKGLQIAGNSIMPILTYLGQPIADRFVTHAEQFNQNINSQSFASANLARQSVDTFRQYMAIALMFSVQATELRTCTASKKETYDPRDGYLSDESRGLYDAVRRVIGRDYSKDRPYVFDDDQQALDEDIEKLSLDLAQADRGIIGGAVAKTLGTLADDAI